MRQLLRALRTHYPAYAAAAAESWQKRRLRLAGYRHEGSLPVRALEVGCGLQYPYVALFHSAGVNVVGIDIEPLVRRDLRAGKYRDLVRGQGPVIALRRLASDALFHLAFYRPLGRLARLPLRHAGSPLVRMDATRCGFASESFDFVYSSACFEHLPDVDATLAEIDRVLKPEGIAEIEIHLFASMTGGHDPDLYDHRAPPAGFPLWGHLLDPDWKAPLFLNRWRDRQYREAFAPRFEVLERIVTSRHGHEYLTPDIEATLASRYPPEELSTESVLYVLRKPRSAEEQTNGRS